MSRPPYAPRGLLGVLTPQANTTVEPEFALLLPPGMAMLNARMTSDKPTIIARLLDYLAALERHAGQFANAPVEAIAFACTGASYFAMPEAEDAAVGRIEATTGLPFITTARAVRDALDLLGARRIGLVSPYPDDLTRAGIAYWEARGYEVATVSGSVLREGAFHPIYAMDHDGATRALMALNPEGLDAIVMLGTGMPTLAAIRATPFHGGVPVLSCMLALGWASASVLGRPQAVLPWIEGRGWGERLDSVFAGGQTGAASHTGEHPLAQPAHPAAVNGLTLAQAEIITDAALAKGREMGFLPLTVVVLDAGGQMKVVKREDGCSIARQDIAHGKAYGALAMGFGTRELARRATGAPGFTNALSDLTGGRAVPVPGGVLVRDANNTLLGAVGISGDNSNNDEVCCIAGIEAAGLAPDTGDPA